MSTVDNRNDKKTADLPPYGPRNPDPITDTPGSHPIETGVGALVGGAATGAAIGVAAGPVGVVAGAVIGAVAGGYAGKGIGELIDPTTEDNWLREWWASRKETKSNRTHEDYRHAYRYGLESSTKLGDKKFDDVETHMRTEWPTEPTRATLPWEEARPAVRHAYDRACEYRVKPKM